MAVIEPLPLPTLAILDPHHFESFVAVRVGVVLQVDAALGGPARDVVDLAGADVEGATSADLHDAAAETDALTHEIHAQELGDALQALDALTLHLDEIGAQRPPPIGPGGQPAEAEAAFASLRDAGLEDATRAIADRTRILQGINPLSPE